MIRKAMAVCGVALLAAAVGAKEINNFFDGDFPQLIPSVQQLERTETGYTIPREIRISAPAGAEREAELIAEIIRGRFGVIRPRIVPAGETAECRLALTDAGVRY